MNNNNLIHTRQRRGGWWPLRRRARSWWQWWCPSGWGGVSCPRWTSWPAAPSALGRSGGPAGRSTAGLPPYRRLASKSVWSRNVELLYQALTGSRYYWENFRVMFSRARLVTYWPVVVYRAGPWSAAPARGLTPARSESCCSPWLSCKLSGSRAGGCVEQGTASTSERQRWNSGQVTTQSSTPSLTLLPLPRHHLYPLWFARWGLRMIGRCRDREGCM